MAEQLSQSQIDALLARFQSGDVPADSEPVQKVKEYDFKSPKKFTKEQLKTLDGVYENFCRMFSSYISGLVRTMCEVEILQIEEQRYYEYNNALPDSALIGMFSFLPREKKYSEANIIMDMSTAIGYYMVERLLGGSGSNYSPNRDFTDIEIDILNNVFEQTAGHLQEAWRHYVDVDTLFKNIETNARLIQVLAPEDIVVIVAMSIKIGNVSGNLSVCMPAENLEEMIDKFSSKYAKISKRLNPEIEEKRKQIIYDELNLTDLELKAVLGNVQMELRDILQLQVADIIVLNKKIDTDISITVDDVPWFNAKLGETKTQKLVKLVSSIA